MVKLLEYEAKGLLKQAHITLPDSQLIRNQNESLSLPLPVVLKAQIPVGGRGKAGGIIAVRTVAEYKSGLSRLLGKPILGHIPSALLAEVKLAVAQELYLALSIDRSSQSLVLLAHKNGGVEIETVTRTNQGSLVKIPLESGPTEATVNSLIKHYGLTESFTPQLLRLVAALMITLTKHDALLVEINPLVVTRAGDLVCADAKVELDDAAAFRHPEWQFENQVTKSQFVVLHKNGNVASMANGAGLAMATVDAISSMGGIPANFLDIGGGTNQQGMLDAFSNIAAIKSVRAIVINVFAGITRCDEVAEAIVAAKQRFRQLPPLYIRLSGTNENSGKALLRQHGIATLPTLTACVESAVKAMPHV